MSNIVSLAKIKRQRAPKSVIHVRVLYKNGFVMKQDAPWDRWMKDTQDQKVIREWIKRMKKSGLRRLTIELN